MTAMDDILIRKATESDLPAIGKLLAELVNAMDDTEGVDIRVAVENYSNLLKDPGSHFLVAEIVGTPVGFINFAIRQTVLHRSPSGLIDELVVAKEHEGRGIGKQLVLAAIEKCQQLGCCEVEVSTEKTNVEARKFYRKCGFEERGMLLEMDL
jgi:ribosomal protein S18 acetylase RimI-like enzyme